MPSAYIDRGLVKWGAFDALIGYTSMLQEMRYKLGKKSRPELSEDALETLDRNLRTAAHEKTEVEIRYYKDGYFRTTFGTIWKLDFEQRTVVLSTREKLSADDIMEIDFIN